MTEEKNSFEKALSTPASNGHNLADYDASVLVPEKSQMEVIIKKQDQGNGASVLVTGAAGFIGSNLGNFYDKISDAVGGIEVGQV